jgi:hypothetical protein
MSGASRMIVLQVALHSFGTKLALIDRELLPRLEPDHFAVFDLELNAALDAAKAAMRFHELVRLARVLATCRREGERRTKTEVFLGHDQMRHLLPLIISSSPDAGADDKARKCRSDAGFPV